MGVLVQCSLCSFIHLSSTMSGQNETINWTVVVEVLTLLHSFMGLHQFFWITSPVEGHSEGTSCGVF